MDYNDKQVLITGGNDGIGKQTTLGLARMGYSITIACRNQEKGKAALAEIIAASGNERIDLLPLDLADLQDVRRAASTFTERGKPLDVLINNAGIVVTELQKTVQGYELQFGVNHLGHFLLTSLLLDALQAAPAPRVVNVSSHVHYSGSMDFDNLRGEKAGYNGLKAYAQSKLANVLFTREFARRYPEIACNAIHPGAVRTRFANKSGGWYSLGWTILSPLLISQEKGARTSIYVASDPAVSGVSGQYFYARNKTRYPSRTAQDPELAKQLWVWSEAAVNK